MNESSLEDELAASLGLRYPSPARAQSMAEDTYLKTTPLANRSSNTKLRAISYNLTPGPRANSPSKTIILNTPGLGDASPWQIKVTVEAEPRGSRSPSRSPGPKAKTMRVPLKDADWTPAKSKGRSRKATPKTRSAIQERKPTPRRRKSARLSADSKANIEENTKVEEETTAPTEQPVKRKRGRPRKNSMPEATSPANATEPSVPAFSVKRKRGRPRKNSMPEAISPANATEPSVPAFSPQPQLLQRAARQQVEYAHNEYAKDGEDFIAKDMAYDGSGTVDFAEKANEEPFPLRTLLPSRLSPLPAAASQWANAFSPLPKYTSLSRQIKSPEPVGQHLSSSTKGADSEMWKRMVRPDHRATGNRRFSEVLHRAAQKSPEPEVDLGSEEVSDSEMDAFEPTATGRTIGDATMLQSEEFSLVDVSSLPSLRDPHSSLLERSHLDTPQANIVQPASSKSRKSRLSRTVQFSSPLVSSVRTEQDLQTIHQDQDQNVEGEEQTADNGTLGLEWPLSWQQLPGQRGSYPTQTLSTMSYSQSPNVEPELRHGLSSVSGSNRKSVPSQSSRNSLSKTSSIPLVSQPQSGSRQPASSNELSRLPTPNSGEILFSSPKEHSSALQVSYLRDITFADATYPQIEDTPGQRSQADMSTPPRTPEQVNTSPLKSHRESRSLSSGSKRSWADEAKSPRLVELESNWQKERENVMRSMAMAKSGAVTIESDGESSDDDMGSLSEDQEAGANMTTTAERTADLWQEISASYEEDTQFPRKQRPRQTFSTSKQSKPAEKRPSVKEPISSAGNSRQSSARSCSESGETSSKTSSHYNTVASAEHAPKTPADVADIFARLNADKDEVQSRPPLQQPQFIERRNSNPRKRFIQDVEGSELMDTSDVRQIKHEVQQAQAQALRRPPFAHAGRQGLDTNTRKIPTKLKSIDDTLTTDQDDSADRSSLLSLSGNQRPRRNLFATHTTPTDEECSINDSKSQHIPRDTRSQQATAVPKRRVSIPLQRPSKRTRLTSDTKPTVPSSTYAGNGASTIWRKVNSVLGFYQPPSRPSHPLLQNESIYPFLPATWPWSRRHYQVLDALYQHYKRKPSRYLPSRTREPDNTGLMTAEWRRWSDVTFDHWGYRVRLESSHVTLCILFSQLLVLPNAKEYKRLYGVDLEWGHQDPWKWVGESINKFDVLRFLFAIVAGEMIREDEEAGRRIRRDLDVFRFRRAGEEWRVLGRDARGEEERIWL